MQRVTDAEYLQEIASLVSERRGGAGSLIGPAELKRVSAGLSPEHICPQAALHLAVGGNVASLEWLGARDTPPRRPAASRWPGESREAAWERLHALKVERKRGTIKQFSRDSRRRMIKRVASVNHKRVKHLPVLITLTYPGEWPEDNRVWKRDLQAFRKRLERRWGRIPIVWKLEFQKRGAPHFHLLAYFREGEGSWAIFRKWLSLSWYECVGSGDSAHLRSGTNVEVIRSIRGATAYAAKYVGKVDGETREVGRHWGVWNWGEQIRTIVSVYLSEDEFIKTKRLMGRMRGMKPYAPGPQSRTWGFWALGSDEMWWQIVDYLGIMKPPDFDDSGGSGRRVLSWKLPR